MAKNKGMVHGTDAETGRDKATGTKCPLTKTQFRELAKSLEVRIGVDGPVKHALPKEFSTGSFGWYAGDKVELKVGDHVLKVQVGINLTVVGSKDAAKE